MTDAAEQLSVVLCVVVVLALTAGCAGLVMWIAHGITKRISLWIWGAKSKPEKIEIKIKPKHEAVDPTDESVANVLVVWAKGETAEDGKIFARLVPDWIPACDACTNWKHRKECGSYHPEWDGVDFCYVTMLCKPCMRFAFGHFKETGHLHRYGPIA